MDNVDHFFNVLKPEQGSDYKKDVQYIREHGLKEVKICPYDISDSLLYPFSILELDFLKPSKGSSFYDHEGVAQTLEMMKKIDWKVFSESLGNQLEKKEGRCFNFDDLADIFEGNFIALQKLFERAYKEKLFVYSYCNDDEDDEFNLLLEAYM